MAVVFEVVSVFKAKDKVSITFKQMGKNAKIFGRDSSKAFKKASKSASGFGAITKGILAAGAVQKGIGLLSQGLSSVTGEFISFDSAITQASAKFTDLNLATDKGQAKLLELKKTAREVGATTKFSAAEAAAGLDFYATAGFNAAQAMAVLAPTARLAMAANTDLARVSDIASDSIGIFGLQSENSTKLQANFIKMSDQMAFTMTSTNTNMEALFETIKGAGTIFTEAGQKMSTFNAIAGILAARGIKAEKAGVAMRSIIASLAKATPEAQKVLESLGVSVRDDKGNFKDLFDILQDLRVGFKGMGTAAKLAGMKTLFGKTAFSAASVVLQKTDKDLRQYRKSIEDSSDATEKMADIMGRSLENRLLSLKSAAIDVGFQLFSAFDEKGGRAIETFTAAIREIDMTPVIEGIKDFIGVARGIINFVVEFKTPLKLLATAFIGYRMATAAAATATGLFNVAMAANPIGLTIVAIGLLGGAIALLVTNWDEVTEAAGNFFNAIGRIPSLLFGENDQERLRKQRAATLERVKRESIQEPREPQNRAPNQTTLESRSISETNIRLDIAGAPEGSTVTQPGRRAPQINVNMLEFASP